MSSIMSNLTLVLTSLLTNIGSVITMLLNNELIFFIICLGISASIIFLTIRILIRAITISRFAKGFDEWYEKYNIH